MNIASSWLSDVRDGCLNKTIFAPLCSPPVGLLTSIQREEDEIQRDVI